MVTKIGASDASIIGFQEFEPPQAEGLPQGHRRGVGDRGRQPPGALIHCGRYRLSALGLESRRGPLRLDQVRRPDDPGPAGAVHLDRQAWDRSGGSTPTTPPMPLAERTRCATPRSAPKRRHCGEVQGSEPSTPLFLVGDMNDKVRFKRLFLSVAGPGWSGRQPQRPADRLDHGKPCRHLLRHRGRPEHRRQGAQDTPTTPSFTPPPSWPAQRSGRPRASAGSGCDARQHHGHARWGRSHGQVLVANANIKTRGGLQHPVSAPSPARRRTSSRSTRSRTCRCRRCVPPRPATTPTARRCRRTQTMLGRPWGARSCGARTPGPGSTVAASRSSTTTTSCSRAEQAVGPVRRLGHLPAFRRRGRLGHRGPPHDERVSVPPPVGSRR